ncbi:hypothetical protein [Bacillus rugosus]|uniref:Uncharacterized protein n=1 Tax=Bacillus rugosus TaxID=2715209 RepID=A0ACD4A010_9BACI|nr:hypothetical protein [Bacillus rugosus]UPV79511.1 hypothetical protein M0696_01755 [Bacillus rugosus]
MNNSKARRTSRRASVWNKQPRNQYTDTAKHIDRLRYDLRASRSTYRNHFTYRIKLAPSTIIKSP